MIFGGIVTSCSILTDSHLKDEFRLAVLDTTQKSNPPPNFCNRLYLAVLRFIKYNYLICTFRPDLVLIFTSSGFSLLEKGLMSYWVKIFRIPVFLFPRGGGVLKNYQNSFIVRCLAQFAFAASTKILCQGEQWESFFINELGMSKSELQVIPNWTATDDLLEVGRSRVFNNHDVQNILFVGWLEKEKGIFELLESLNNLKGKYKFLATFIGDGSAKSLFSNRINSYKLGGCVKLAGWHDRSELKKFYSKADIFVLPSWVEGLPNSMIEAMACGLPVVVTDVGNVRSVLIDNYNGKLISPNNVPELSNALNQLLDSIEMRKYLGKNAYRSTSTNFNSKDSIQILIKFLLKQVDFQK